jgi:DNA-binding GntR family transcriptional regulator
MDYLKDQLNQNVLKPGDEIHINELSETLGVSRTPIREALIQLVKEGFVDLVSRKMFRIRKLTLKEIKYIYQIIGLLEATASGFACEKITDNEIIELEENYRSMEKALAANDFSLYLELNDKCHKILSKYCDNPILTDIVHKLKERLYDFPKIIVNIPEWEELMMSDHSRMIQLLKERDRDGLEDLIKNIHWNFERSYPYILQYYEIFNLTESSDGKSSGGTAGGAK